ncbi:SulP family inorganic anion transporter [Thiocapsa roseopersicina]|uniref:High affinity sulphate transporter 1 n=1 Tax=Thiocapsa roseopersicina TaxID=1058 RepID=A0A1H2UE52_THIRO|nr:sulfate permease [Thiocapsa roseopersicina]SDW54287.1 high affinity sulphate transporter 1 [Thiocapsa roseopersicina]
MAVPEQHDNRIRRLVGRVAPGLDAFSRYRVSWLPGDIAAGLSVAAVALPVGIAYADLAGVPPVIGIYAAIFPLFAYALFGSSRQLIIGPDAATCMMLAAALGPLAGGDPEYYRALVIVMSLIVGLIYVVMGVARLGFIAGFLSRPILVGYLNGIALLIIVGQMGKLFGISVAADDFFPQLLETLAKLGDAHLPTVTLGMTLLIGLAALRRFLPGVPAALVVVVVGIGLSAGLNLQQLGVAVVGSVPAGLPELFHIPILPVEDYPTLVRDAAGLVLVSFTGGILTAKSFAQRNRYEIDPDRELIAFGAGNIVSGLAQGFPVTGTDSRTAVNDAMGGKSQLVGVVAGGVMLLSLFFLTEPLAYVPTTALAAVIVVAAVGLFDVATLRELSAMSRVELGFSLGTTLGVLVLGVLPGVLLAVVLSLLLLLMLTSRPTDAVLGRVPGMKGYHHRKDYPEARTLPGLLLYRFNADLVFFNVDYFKARLLAAIAASETPVEWVVIDASPINVIDSTALKQVEQLIDELAARGVVFAVARRKHAVRRLFEASWVDVRRELTDASNYPTLTSAVDAFNARSRRDAEG